MVRQSFKIPKLLLLQIELTFLMIPGSFEVPLDVGLASQDRGTPIMVSFQHPIRHEE